MNSDPRFPKLFIAAHPLIRERLGRLRDKNISHAEFRAVLEELSIFLFYEAARALEVKPVRVPTPLEITDAQALLRRVVLVPILRAGLGMAGAILRVLPETSVGMIGMYRNEDTLQPVDYYLKLPANLAEVGVFVLDPMLATGGSAVAALDTLKKAGAERITMACLICAPQGVQNVFAHHPDVPVYTASLDRELNEKGYIVPGLGDAGDRYFGT